MKDTTITQFKNMADLISHMNEHDTFNHKDLDLLDCQIRDSDLEKVFTSLASKPEFFHTVETLDLSKNDLQNPNFANLEKYFPQLKTLYLEQQKNLSEVPEIEHGRLTSLSLSGNQIQAFESYKLSLPELRRLAARDNIISQSDPKYEAIPINLYLFPDLEEAYFANNCLPHPPRFNHRNLKILDISGNEDLINGWSQLRRENLLYFKRPQKTDVWRRFKTLKRPARELEDGLVDETEKKPKHSRKENEELQFSILYGNQSYYSLSHEVIASGSGTRIKLVRRHDTGEMAVAKIFNLSHARLMYEDPNMSEEYTNKKIAEMQNEAHILKKLGLSIDFILIEKEDNTICYLIMPWFQYPDLITWINESECLSEESFMTVVHNILKVLKDLHDKNIVHNDFNIQNLLIDRKTLEVICIDFGISLDLENPSDSVMEDLSDSYHFQYDIARDKVRTPQSDLFSLGYLLGDLIKKFNLPPDKKLHILNDLIPRLKSIDPTQRPDLNAIQEFFNDLFPEHALPELFENLTINKEVDDPIKDSNTYTPGYNSDELNESSRKTSSNSGDTKNENYEASHPISATPSDIESKNKEVSQKLRASSKNKKGCCSIM